MANNLDLNQAHKQGERPLLPKGTYRLRAHIRPGGVGDEGLLRLANNMVSELLELDLTAVEGEHAGTSFRIWLTLYAGDTPTPGQCEAINISRTTLRAMLESAHAIDPDDDGEAARKVRDEATQTLRVFDGLTFYALVGVEPSNRYGDRNKVVRVVTPNMKEWPVKPQSSQQNGPSPQPRKTTAEDMGDGIPFS
jgi:hypothetical protein